MIAGAKERARSSLEKFANANACDFGVGIEGGLFKIHESYFLTAYAVTINKDGNSGIGGSPVIQLPGSWSIKDSATFELGDYVDSITKKTNLKQHEGVMGHLTDNHLPRKDALKYAVLCSYYALKNSTS